MCSRAAAHIHHVVQSVVQYERVGHPYPVGLHGVPRSVIIIADVGIVEVRDLPTAELSMRPCCS